MCTQAALCSPNPSRPRHLPFAVSGEGSPTGLWLLWCESRKIVIPVLCFQTQTEISDEKMLLRASRQQTKEYLHLLLETGRSLALGMAPVQSPGAVLVSLGTLSSLIFPW